MLAHGALEGSPDNSLLVHLAALGALPHLSGVPLRHTRAEATPGRLGRTQVRRFRGASPPLASDCPYCWGAKAKAVLWRLLRGAPEGRLGTTAHGHRGAARLGLLAVRTAGGGQRGLDRRLSPGWRAALSVHVLLEEHPG